MLSKATLGIALCGFGCMLLFYASGCEDGCVRNSDCPTSFECTDALCVLRAPVGDSGMDAQTEDDAGE